MERSLIISVFWLSRPQNILIIILTMIGVAYSLNSIQGIQFDRLDFSLLLASTVLIAAAGNMINDYFDVRADRVNKPHKLIISKHMKKRWAIILHWSFNFSALLISIYLSSKYQTFWYVFVHLLAINALWFYSVYFKKKVFVGNFLIALLTGFIPLLALSYFVFSRDETLLPLKMGYHWYENPNFHIVYLLSFFAMMQNLAREICKDINDIPGDRKIHVTSIPMKYGMKTTKIIIAVILLIQILCLLIVNEVYTIHITSTVYYVLIAALSVNFIIVLMMRKNSLFLKFSEPLLKISMLIGASTLFL